MFKVTIVDLKGNESYCVLCDKDKETMTKIKFGRNFNDEDIDSPLCICNDCAKELANKILILLMPQQRVP